MWIVAVFGLGCEAKDVSNNSQRGRVNVTTNGRPPFLVSTTTPTPTMTSSNDRFRQRSLGMKTFFCLAPPQPINGEYKLDQASCLTNTNCSVPAGTALIQGSRLTYSCNPGYRKIDQDTVFCNVRGEWSAIPTCTEVKCSSLTSVSTTVTCFLRGEWENCDNLQTVPDTQVAVSCRHGYRKDFTITQKDEVSCSANGTWQPDPIKCIPACGREITRQRSLMIDGRMANVADFPWHASIHIQRKNGSRTQKDFACGATIIHSNFLLTAAHCVYDETREETVDPTTLFVITGNIYRDYDFPKHDPLIVRKAEVKEVYVHCHFYGYKGNYASDIALLELNQPLKFNEILLPACLDDFGYSEQLLGNDKSGKVAGFGITATGHTSSILQTLPIPLIPDSQCRVSRNAADNQAFITEDKFCGGYNNGSALCDGDSGGGLVIRRGDQWYLSGIVSTSLGVDTSGGTATCAKHSYSLFIKVYKYVPWIQDVLYYAGRKKSIRRQCKENSDPCVAPPQPVNGEWRHYCKGNMSDCRPPDGPVFPNNWQLYYSCSPGFIMDESQYVTCRYDGTWTPIPTCKPSPDVFCRMMNASAISNVCNWQEQCRSEYRKQFDKYPTDGACRYPGQESICCATTSNRPTPIQPEHRPDGEKGAIARQKCKDYSRYVYSAKCPPVAADDQLPVVPNRVGKTRAERMRFPHMAAVGYNEEKSEGIIDWLCGGTLISEIFVLTAAHCLRSEIWGDAKWVRVGGLNLVQSANGGTPINRRIIQQIKYPGFQPPGKYHDIGLLRLETRVPFNGWIRPACLHTEPYLRTDEATATGWGKLDDFDDHGTDDLQKVILPIADHRNCPELEGIKFENLKDWFICAGAKGKDTCQGDSGGPLVILSEEYHCIHDVIGITANGEFCGHRPALYTRVSYYVPWIESIVWPQE